MQILENEQFESRREAIWPNANGLQWIWEVMGKGGKGSCLNEPGLESTISRRASQGEGGK